MKTHAMVLGSIVAMTLTSSTAWASKNYPQVVESFWDVRTLPVKSGKGCLLCHKSEAGGKNTTTKPFGVTLKNKGGTIGASPGSLQRGLEYVRLRGTNSDGDPVADYQEIVVDGTDPNDKNDYVPPPPPPPPPEGGQGGEGSSSGEAGSTGEGGTTGVTVSQTDYPPLSPSELPPPYVHGCTVSEPASGSPGELITLLAIALFRSFRSRKLPSCRAHRVRA